MIYLKQLIGCIAIIVTLTSCGMFGVHLKVHNPEVAGRYPKFSTETTLFGELSTMLSNFDVTFYNLDITIDPYQKKVRGWVAISATALADIDSVQLNLDQTLAINELRWQKREGSPLNYSRKFKVVYVKLNNRVKKGDAFSLHIKYSGKPVIAKKPPWSGGLVWKHDKEKKAWAGVACESEGASIWFPCKDHTSDEPDSVKMSFTIPDTTLSVVANGVFTGLAKNDNSKTFNWKVTYPINLYDITFYIGNFAKIEDTYTGITGKSLKLTHYVLKPNVDKATRHFKQVKEYIKIYEQLYGEYPWYSDGFKLVEAPYAGMEHQTAIAYGSGYKNDLYNKEDYIMLHETGHEWFGNAISVADLADVWLQEGVTTYGEALFLEKKYGPAQYLNHLLVHRLFIKNKFPVVGPVGKRYFNYRDGDPYSKGAWVMHSLRNSINNDSLFFKVIKTFYEENKLNVTDSKTFIATVNQITDKNYQWFFDQYLYQSKAPFFEYQISKDGAMYYRWIAVAATFNKLAVPFSITERNKNYELYPDNTIQKFIFPEAGEKFNVVFNNNNALFGLKKNNKLRAAYQHQQKDKQEEQIHTIK